VRILGSLLITVTITVVVLTSCAGAPATPPIVEPTSHELVQGETEIAASIVFLNVGKADCILLTVKDRAYLVDTGSGSSVPAMFYALDMMGVERLDGLFLTHTHNDHIGGLNDLAKKIPISTLYSSAISKADKNGANKIDSMAKDLGLEHRKLSAGDVVPVIDDIKFTVLGPLEYDSNDDNDNSLVMSIELSGQVALLAGDMQFTMEESLVGNGVDLKADILKVGNHGNPDTTSREFAESVGAKYAVISTDTKVDKNSANKKVLANLAPAEIYITQDYPYGIKFDISPSGKILISSLE